MILLKINPLLFLYNDKKLKSISQKIAKYDHYLFYLTRSEIRIGTFKILIFPCIILDM